MAKRRDPGDGAVYQRPNGTWSAQLDLGLGTKGERRRKTVYGKSKPEVLRKLNEARQQLRERGDLATSETQLGKWLDYWLLEIAGKRVKPKTLATYRSAVEHQIKPSIGTIRLGRLSAAHLRKMHNDIMADLSPTTAHHAHRVLSSALKDARIEGRVSHNIASEVSAPSKADSERTGLSAKAAMRVLSKAEGDGRWLLALLYGMRQGERLGLRWSHVDFETNLLDLSWSLARISWAHGCVPDGTEPTCDRTKRSCPAKRLPIPKGMKNVKLERNYVLLTPKTKGSIRVVPMIPPIRIMLQQRLNAVQAERPGYTTDHDLVWCEPNGGPIDPRDDWQAWTDLLERAKIPHVTLHEARNTAATLLLEAKVDAKIIGAILGHSQIVTTRGYQTVGVELASQALEGLATTLQLT